MIQFTGTHLNEVFVFLWIWNEYHIKQLPSLIPSNCLIRVRVHAVPTSCDPQSPDFCTPPEGATTILTIKAQGGLAINLLGIHVDVWPLCIAVYTVGTATLTAAQQTETETLNNFLQAVHGLIPSVPSV